MCPHTNHWTRSRLTDGWEKSSSRWHNSSRNTGITYRHWTSSSSKGHLKSKNHFHSSTFLQKSTRHCGKYARLPPSMVVKPKDSENGWIISSKKYATTSPAFLIAAQDSSKRSSSFPNSRQMHDYSQQMRWACIPTSIQLTLSMLFRSFLTRICESTWTYRLSLMPLQLSCAVDCSNLMTLFGINTLALSWVHHQLPCTQHYIS